MAALRFLYAALQRLGMIIVGEGGMLRIESEF